MGDYALTVAQDTLLRLTQDNGGSVAADPVATSTFGAPLSAFWWVDSASGAAAPNGSSGSPFPTIAAALEAANAAELEELTLGLVAGFYGDGVFDATLSTVEDLTIWTPVDAWRAEIEPQFDSFAWTPPLSGEGSLQLVGIAIIGQLVLPPSAIGALLLTKCAIGEVSGGLIALTALGTRLGPVACQFAILQDSNVGGPLNCSEGIAALNSFLVLDGSYGGSLATFTGCDLTNSGNTITFAGGGSQHIRFVDCLFSDAPPIALTCTAAGTVHFDNVSLSSFVDRGWPLVNATVRDLALVSALISVPVPALAAGALGYVDLTTVATDLVGLRVGDPVFYNPQADVQAAGAGAGGPREVRVSAPSTIRLAFQGTTTAHAVNFLFWRG